MLIRMEFEMIFFSGNFRRSIYPFCECGLLTTPLRRGLLSKVSTAGAAPAGAQQRFTGSELGSGSISASRRLSAHSCVQHHFSAQAADISPKGENEILPV